MPEPPTATSPVLPRPAASLLVVRMAAAEPEVLMGLRGARHRFMPNKLVFPGGTVDAEDHLAPAATRLHPQVLARLQAGAGRSLAPALAMAAARELEEETGLTLGRPPRLAGLDYLCRAITPSFMPMRFDARFFVVDASEVCGTLAGSGELEGLRFYRPVETLALDLALVTRTVLERLLAWLELDPLQRAARTRTAMLTERNWHEE
jgi:8-oxo-dGTP pyrophosphatase MutT (NUDIX family)